MLAVILVMTVSLVEIWQPEHFGKDKKSFIYQQLMAFNDFLDQFSKDCFSVLDAANTKHQLRIKESLYISWLKPILNK